MLERNEKSRLQWHCRRGMLELDLILQKFFKNQIDHLSSQQIELFDKLLNYTDPELYAWLMGHEDPQDEELLEIVATIRHYT